MNRTFPMLAIVVPCFNEEEVLPETIKQLTIVLTELMTENIIRDDSFLLFVDDGSSDRTWSIIAKASIENPYVTGIKLTRNVGHQNALLAGLHKAYKECDCAVSIDADLQDDVSTIKSFLKKYREGYDIVYGVRNRRDTDSPFKRTTAHFFYKITEKLGIQLVYNHADFRLLSKRALSELMRYEENNLFLRGIIPLLGLPSAKIYYERRERAAGKTKYPLKKMISFALDGITSFSIAPIRWITLSGFILFVLSIAAGGYALIQKYTGSAIAGWTSLMISLWFLGGLQLVAIGVIGEYMGKIFTEVKARPRYAIDIDLIENPIGKNRHKERFYRNERNRKADQR